MMVSKVMALQIGVILAVVGLGSSVRAAESYDQTLMKVRLLEAEQKNIEAALGLEQLLQRFPQDYELLVFAARLHFKNSNYPQAADRYRKAVDLSAGALESRLGLAWSLLHLGDPSAAHTLFKEVLRESPAHLSARQGLVMSQPAPLVVLSPSFSATVQGYSDHASKSWGIGGLLALPLLIKDRVFIEVDYRYSHFFGPRGQGGNGNGNGNSNGSKITSLFAQHEGYISGGLVVSRCGILGQYALIYDGDSAEVAHVAGLSARYSPWGDLLLDLNASIYSDLVVLRAAPAWRIRPLPWLSITPGLAVQGTLARIGESASETLVTGSLGVAVSGAVGSLWLGGKVGAERRPAYLSVPEVFNIPEQINFGLWAGASLKVGQGVLYLAYEMNQLELERVTSMMHLATLGLRWNFPGSSKGGTNE